MLTQNGLQLKFARPAKKLADWLKSDLPQRYELALIIALGVACRLFLSSI